jgi:hypothetical protein
MPATLGCGLRARIAALTKDANRYRSRRNWRALAGLLLATAVTSPASAASSETAPSAAGPQLAAVAHEARRAVAIIDWFYGEHHACPQPSRPDELKELQSELGDGFSADPQGQFVAISGISMPPGWLYYASPSHPDRCTLWRELGRDAAVIWRRHSYGANWSFNPGDGKPETAIRLGQ